MELEEAAIIDGSNDLITFVRIILPLSAPVLASVSLFYAVSHWNSYFNAMLYINNSDMEVITIVLRRLVFLTTQVAEDSTFDWGAAGMPPIKAVKMATTVPVSYTHLDVYKRQPCACRRPMPPRQAGRCCTTSRPTSSAPATAMIRCWSMRSRQL